MMPMDTGNKLYFRRMDVMDIKGPKIKKYMEEFIVTPGREVKLRKFKTGWAINDELKNLDDNKAKVKAVEILNKDRDRLAKELFIAGCAARHGYGRQGRGYPACNVRRQSSGVFGIRVQGPHINRACT
jgi:hypothetical protein